MPRAFRFWKPTGLIGTWKSRACRYALSQLTAGKGVESDESEILVATAEIADQWRARALNLRANGWAFAAGDSISFMCNCPPAGVLTGDARIRPCRRYQICPFCWCRHYTADLYERLDLRLHTPDAKLVDLLEVRNTWYFDRDYPLKSLADWIRTQKPAALKSQLPPTLGAFVLCIIEPVTRYVDDVGRPAWLLHHRTLAMIDGCAYGNETKHIQPLEGPDGELSVPFVKRVPGPVKRQQLVGSVGRTTLYPKGLLRSDVKRTLAALSLRSPKYNKTKTKKQHAGCRFSAYYGCLRRSPMDAMFKSKSDETEEL